MGRPRVLGREIIGMFNFGSVRVAHAHEAKLGIVFGPHSAEGAKSATFTNYLKVLGNVSSAANIRNIFDPHVAHNNFRMPV